MYKNINDREAAHKRAGQLISYGIGFLLFLLVMAAITHQEKVTEKPGVYCTGYSLIPNNKTHVVNCNGDTVRYSYKRLKPLR